MILRPPPHERLELRIGLLRQDHLEAHVLIAPLPALLIHDPLAAQAERRAGIGALGHAHRYRAVDRRHLHLATEHRLGEADRQIDVHVVVLAREEGVRLDVHLDVGIARRQAAGFLLKAAVLQKLFDTIAGRYADRNGGYTRIIKLGYREGDGADLAVIELLGSELSVKKAEKAAAKAEADKAKAAKKPKADKSDT